MSKKNDKTANVNVAIDSITEALKKLGYPVQGLKDAAVRLSWVPALAGDLVEYVKMGAPAVTGGAPVPQVLLRPLNDGFTVALLMTDYLLEPTGAFLMGSALITHRDEALGMLEKIVLDGVSVRNPNGSFENMDVPAAHKLPQCKVCGARLFKKYETCPECGSPI
ncbi:MAG: hypothetical protein FIA99_09850 [Ruminiclostridium sp.]|nr:hypothetical protein [Ruminiclostridium sp.]